MRSIELFKPAILLKNTENKAEQKLQFNGGISKNVQDSFILTKISTSQIQFSGKPVFFTKARQLTMMLAALNLGGIGTAEAAQDLSGERIKLTCETAPFKDYLPAQLFSHAGSGIEVTQLTNDEGDPIRQNQVAIPVPPNTRVCDDGVNFDVLVKDPAASKDVILAANVESVFIEEKRGQTFLTFMINGPVSE